MTVSARLVLVLALVSFAMQPVVAAPLTSDDLGFAFGEKAGASQVEKPTAKAVDSTLRLASLQPLSAQEMRETEGTNWGLAAYHPGHPGDGLRPPTHRPGLPIHRPGPPTYHPGPPTHRPGDRLMPPALHRPGPPVTR